MSVGQLGGAEEASLPQHEMLADVSHGSKAERLRADVFRYCPPIAEICLWMLVLTELENACRPRSVVSSRRVTFAAAARAVDHQL